MSPHPLVLLVSAAVWLGSPPVAADAPLLSPLQLRELTGADGCGWRFLERRPAAGAAWIERWRPVDCARSAEVNLRLVEAVDGELTVTRLLPGTTRQPPVVQREATLVVLARAGDRTCRDRRVVDTERVARAARVDVERWTVRACGRERRFRLTFDSVAGGLPGIEVTAEPEPSR